MAIVRKTLIISGLQIFPAESGGQIRTATLAEALAESGDDVTVYSFTGRKRDYFAFAKSTSTVISKNITEYTNRNLIFGIIQYFCYRFNFPPFWLTLLLAFYLPRELRGLLLKTDNVLIDFPFLYPAGRKSRHGYVLNTHNVEVNLCAGGIRRSMIAYVEKNAMRSASLVLSCTTADLEYFKKHYGLPASKSRLVPNALNLAKIESALQTYNKEQIRANLQIDQQTSLILFSGSSYFANTEAFKFIKSFCIEKQNFLRAMNIKFLIAGTVSDMPINSEFYLATAKVSDVHRYFIACDAAINPVSIGSGSNIKMCEYIAFGLPILTTHFGARGFQLQHGVSCFYFDFNDLEHVLLTAFSEKDSQRNESIARRAMMDNRKQIDMRENIQTEPIFF
ncbi:MAG: hypothetical protein A2X86_13945 [Bdellovibrionales bacterium GWA2_49_15]|nr:MAG: hypothetical protein A2X86_13945 [Bdellovibrionales bacterium GWA2_49_15]HAZ13631.1 hypothetical protein [Bdellovibrionales bacterium]